MIDVILKISTIFVMIFIGYIAVKLKFVPSKAQEELVKLILNINIPCMLLCSITGNEISSDSLMTTVKMFGYSGIYFIVAALGSILLTKLFRIKTENDIGVYQMIFTSINTGFIGFPVTKALFGDAALYFMVLHNIVLNICLYSICTLQLNGTGLKKGMLSKTMKSMINPCIISAVIGILLLFMGIHIPGYIDGIIAPIGDATIPLAMIIVGLQLAEGKIADCFKNKKLILFCIVVMLLRPLAVLCIVSMLPIEEVLKTVLVLGSAFPPVTTISALAANEGRNYKLAADATIITTLMAAITLPAIAMLIHIFI